MDKTPTMTTNQSTQITRFKQAKPQISSQTNGTDKKRHSFVPFLLLIVCLAVLLPSCKALKKGGSSKTQKGIEFLESKINETRFDADSFSGKMKVQFWENESKLPNINVDIRMKKDSVIWLSASPALGIKIELVRAIITPDRVQVMDRYNKNYYDKDFDFLKQYIDYPLDFETLQAMLYGHSIQQTDFNKVMTTGDQHRLSSEDCTLFLNNNDFTIVQMIVDDEQYNRSFIANFEEYQNIDGKQFSNKRNYLMKSETNYVVNLQFSKIKTDNGLEFPFKVSSKYKKVD